MNKPLYIHDCEHCKFLGSAHLHNKKCDWYECYNGSSIKDQRTIIARRSSDGPDYNSGTLFACSIVTRLEMTALSLGLDLTQDEKERLLHIMFNNQSQKEDQLGSLCHDKDYLDSLYHDHNDDLLGSSNYYNLDRN